MSEGPSQVLLDNWRRWVEGALGGTPAQQDRAVRAAVAAVAARASSDAVQQAARLAWSGGEAAHVATYSRPPAMVMQPGVAPGAGTGFPGGDGFPTGEGRAIACRFEKSGPSRPLR